MKIGIISDTHDQLDRIHDAIELFRKEKVGAVIHCGDFVAPFAIRLFQKLNSPFYAVFGNNDGERQGLLKEVRIFGGELFIPPHLYTIEDKTILVYHDPPVWEKPGSLALRPDYILYGHTHHPDYKTQNGIPVINPGEACGWLTGRAYAGILDLESGNYVSLSLIKKLKDLP